MLNNLMNLEFSSIVIIRSLVELFMIICVVYIISSLFKCINNR
jgi:hypothetical protein